MDADVLALVEGEPRRFPATRTEALALTVITAPAKATPAALRGEPRRADRGAHRQVEPTDRRAPTPRLRRAGSRRSRRSARPG